MLKVGLTGGYATGKSFVAQELEKYGCHLVYADRLGHEALAPAGDAYEAAVALFGTSILSPDGTIDRKKLGALVFREPELLKQLADLIHPAVFRAEEGLLAKLRETHPKGIVVLEAAILIETGRYRQYDRVIVTVCSVEKQIIRGMKRDHLTREEVLERLARQMPLNEKRRFAHYVIDTDGEKDATAAQVNEVYQSLARLAEEQL